MKKLLLLSIFLTSSALATIKSEKTETEKWQYLNEQLIIAPKAMSDNKQFDSLNFSVSLLGSFVGLSIGHLLFKTYFNNDHLYPNDTIKAIIAFLFKLAFIAGGGKIANKITKGMTQEDYEKQALKILLSSWPSQKGLIPEAIHYRFDEAKKLTHEELEGQIDMLCYLIKTQIEKHIA